MKLLSGIVVSFSAVGGADARLASPFHSEPGTKASLISQFPDTRIDLDLVSHMADMNAMMGRTHPPGWPLAPVNINRGKGRRSRRAKHGQELYSDTGMGVGMGMGMGMGRGMGMGMDMGSSDMDNTQEAGHQFAKQKHKLRSFKHSEHMELAKHVPQNETDQLKSKLHHSHHELIASDLSKNQADIADASHVSETPDSDAESDGSTQRLVEMTDQWNSGELDEVVEQLEDISSKSSNDFPESSDGPVEDTVRRSSKANATATSIHKTADDVMSDVGGRAYAVNGRFSSRAAGDAEKRSDVQKAADDAVDAVKSTVKVLHETRIAEDSSFEDTSGDDASQPMADPHASSMQEHLAEVLERMRAKKVASVAHDVEVKHINHGKDEHILRENESNITNAGASDAAEDLDEVAGKVNDDGSNDQMLEKAQPLLNEEHDKIKSPVQSEGAVVEDMSVEAMFGNDASSTLVDSEAPSTDKRNTQNRSSVKTILARSSKTSSTVGGQIEKAGEDTETKTIEELAIEGGKAEGQAKHVNETRAMPINKSSHILIDDKGPRKGRAPNELDASKLAWLHVPKTGTSFANTLASWACPGLEETEFAGSGENGGNDTVLGSFMEHHGHQCSEGFSFCNGHTPIGRGSCNDWDAHEGHFVGMFREPEQRIIAGYKQNCNGVPGKDHTLRSYADMVSGCSVKMLNGQECGSNITVTSDMVRHAIKRVEEGFAFAGLTEEWALSVCLFHTMYGGKCHPREFMDIRPGLMHRDMPYDASELNGWVDPFDGALYAHASTVFWDNIAKYGVSPDTCKRTVCSGTPDEFKLSVLRQR